MFKRLLLLLTLITVTSPAFAMRVGDIDADIPNMMCVVYDSGELTSAVTSIDITGLEGDTDTLYEVFFRFIMDGDGTVSMRFNDQNAQVYGYQRMKGADSTASAERGTSQWNLGIGGGNDGYQVLNHMIIHTGNDLSTTGVQTYLRSTVGTYVGSLYKEGFVWNNTDEVTSLNISGTGFTKTVFDYNGDGFYDLDNVPKTIPLTC